jgi:hypothetical protein
MGCGAEALTIVLCCAAQRCAESCMVCCRPVQVLPWGVALCRCCHGLSPCAGAAMGCRPVQVLPWGVALCRCCHGVLPCAGAAMVCRPVQVLPWGVALCRCCHGVLPCALCAVCCAVQVLPWGVALRHVSLCCAVLTPVSCALPLCFVCCVLCCAGAAMGCGAEALTIVSMLSVPSVFFRPPDRAEESGQCR